MTRPDPPGAPSRRLAAARRLLRRLAPVALGIAGAWLGLLVWGSQLVDVGPFRVELDAGFGRGVTDIALPPFGQIRANTHLAPIHVRASWKDVNVRRLTDLIQDEGFEGLVLQVEEDALDSLPPFALRALAAAAAGGLLLSLAVYRRDRRAIEIAVVAALLSTVGSGASTAATYRTAAFLSPSFSGSLSLAPQLIGPVRSAAERIDYFRDELRRVVEGAVNAYTSVQANPLGAGDEIRVLHISDIHLSPLGFEFAKEIAQSFDVDVVIDTGDTTSFGTPAENLVADFIPGFNRPYVWVRGNHDSRGLQEEIASEPNAIVLDGGTTTVADLTIYGLGHPVFLEHRGLPTDVNAFAEEARAAGERVLVDVEALPEPPDVVAVHDDRMAGALAGLVPLVVSGHFHEEGAAVVDGTLYLRLGTTGGAALETFAPGEGIPLAAEILYIDPPGVSGGRSKLVAYDVIRQFPETGDLTIERHLVEDEFGDLGPAETQGPAP